MPRLADFVRARHLIFMELPKVFQRPGLEAFRDLDARKVLFNLPLKLPLFDAPLAATGVFAFGAVVVNVMEALWLAHLINGRAAAGAAIPVAVRELVPAGITNDLVFFVRRHARPALAAADEAGVGESGRFARTGRTIPTKEGLDAIEFVFGDHWLVIAPIPLVASLWILEPAVVERFGKELVNAASGERLAAHLLGLAGAKTPLVVGHSQNLRRGVEAGEHQIPHPAKEREPFRIVYQIFFAAVLELVVEVAHGRHAGIPALLHFRSQASFDVATQIIDVFLSHAELDVHENDIVIVLAEGLGGGDDSDAVLLDGPDDGATVHRVASQTVELPADDALGFASVKPLHHSVEHRPSGLLGGFRFGQNLDRRQVLFLGQSLHLSNLRFNGKHLPIFGFARFTAIDEVTRHGFGEAYG